VVDWANSFIFNFIFYEGMDVNFNNKIIGFWEWFNTIGNELLLDTTNTSLISQLDNRVSTMGRFDWEIGPFNEGEFYFAISPNLDIERLSVTQHIISYAPECERWNFLPSKPIKYDWNGIWKMKNDLGKEIWVDSNDWKYVLYQFDDKDFDIDVLVGDIEGDMDTCYLAIDIGLTGYLGEEEYMRLIKNIKLVTEFEHTGKASSLKYIKKHIESII